MLDEYSDEEVVGFGDSRGSALGARVRAHPVLLGVVLLLVGGAAVGALMVHDRSAPKLPVLVRAVAVETPSGGIGDASAWDAAPDGRPIGDVRLQGAARLALTDVGGTRADVLGVAGPGIVPQRVPVARIAPTGGVVQVLLRATLDCTAVPLPVPAGSYGISVRAVDGSRHTTGTLGAGSLGRAWDKQVQSACASWVARHDLTATDATATVDPTRPRATVSFSVTNSGDHVAVAKHLDFGGGSGVVVTSTPRGVVTLPPRSTTRLSLDVTLNQCDAVSSFQPTEARTTADVVDVYANGGPRFDSQTVEPLPQGLGSTGIVFDTRAAGVVQSALQTACGGIGPFVTLIPENGVHYDAATRVLSVPVVLDGTPGRVKDIRLEADPHPQGSTPFRALTTATPRLVPDRTGQVHTTLRYRAVRASTCPRAGELVPGFAITARVPVSGGTRVLHYGPQFVPWEQSPILLRLCPSQG